MAYGERGMRIGSGMCRRPLAWAVWAATCIVAATGSAAAEAGQETGRVQLKALRETSGMAASRRQPGTLWLHNDGSSRHLYAVSLQGETLGQAVSSYRIDDFEDVAVGPGPQAGVDYLYLGDIGDNDRRRGFVQVVRMPEPAVRGGGASAGAVVGESFRLTYPDGPHDAEALLVDPQTGEVLIVTKDERATRCYAATLGADPGRDVPLRLAAQLNSVREVSGGDISPDGSLIALRRESEGWLWRRQAGEGVAAALLRAPEPIPVRGKKQAANGEALTFSADGQSYFTISEGNRQRLYEFSVPAVER